VSSALVGAYAKCGDITTAKSAFSEVSSVTEDAILYNTMPTAYANHGLIHEVLSLYQDIYTASIGSNTSYVRRCHLSSQPSWTRRAGEASVQLHAVCSWHESDKSQLRMPN
jgi:hypothetical protein